MAFYTYVRYGLNIKVPLGLVVVPITVITALVLIKGLRLKRRKREGRCLQCGYYRHGLPAQAVCPECGASPVTLEVAVAPTIERK